MMGLTGRQTVVLTSLYLSYVLYVYVRRSFSFAMPTVSETVKLDKSQLGMILSSQSLAYTISKFVCGILVDIVSPNVLLSGGLILSGFTAICFTTTTSAVMMSVIWFMNGLSQGPGWPALAMSLKHVCAPEQFGTAWSIISTSLNVAGMVGPVLTTVLIAQSSWQKCIQLAGVTSIVFGCVAFFLVRTKQDNHPVKPESCNNHDESSTVEGEDMTRWQLLFLPGFLGLCLSMMATSVVQYSTLNWTQLYIVQEKGMTPMLGSAFVSSQELGGIVGSFAVGFLSDFLITKNPRIARHLVRQAVVMYFMLFLTGVLYWITFNLTSSTSQLMVAVMGFCAGFGVYGPVAISGVIAMESGPENRAGTLHAIFGLFSSSGLFLAGLPLSYIAKLYDWQTVFLLLSTLMTMTFLYFLIKLRSAFKSSNQNLFYIF
ncbi:glucose-6-phosphate exchanger SLC37A4-like [Ylistrum balloti]|uniref:glucose-6-phosphate exchanger SLC37A4-like n=1 Tax=Ylistrum balloti TaxID=509963 RepID=UPI002905848A|nr:glucose-6-phosphate exchanger SLC37A4-like [Ylistrum balloti]